MQDELETVPMNDSENSFTEASRKVSGESTDFAFVNLFISLHISSISLLSKIAWQIPSECPLRSPRRTWLTSIRRPVRLETNHRVIIHDHLSSLEANVEPVTSMPAAPGQSPKSRRNRKWRSSRLAGVACTYQRIITLQLARVLLVITILLLCMERSNSKRDWDVNTKIEYKIVIEWIYHDISISICSGPRPVYWDFWEGHRET